MGGVCSNVEKDQADGEKDENDANHPTQQHHQRSPGRLVRNIYHKQARPSADDASAPFLPGSSRSSENMERAQAAIVYSLDRLLDATPGFKKTTIHQLDDRRSVPGLGAGLARYQGPADYERDRAELMKREKVLDFDWTCSQRASTLQRRVDDILQIVKHNDRIEVYGQAAARTGYYGQQHERFPGDHYLTNEDIISRTKLFNIAHMMPKGAHLHIHFNACLLPHVLLDIAKTMERMFITSDYPLTSVDNMDLCKIQFSILTVAKENPGDLFESSYKPRQTMRFADFLREFPTERKNCDADTWLINKLVFHEEEVHNSHQSVLGIWEKFNGRTQMMKGLFNYETAYRRYTRLCLEHFAWDNIQYAEIRPNFMSTNQLFTDDGAHLIDNEGIMKIIMEESTWFQTNHPSTFKGLKVIYCTPRSFENDKVKIALDECLSFKRKWPNWIAGFDLVGEEVKGHPLKKFVPQLLEFRKTCEAENLDIPFLFHCGETLEMGSEPDANLVDALLLNSKRIGHGFALARHPYVMEQMKKKGICLEICPISNEILGLTPRMNGHSVYNLLANNVHCTVNTDNGTLFRSTLSHDFYQIMVGKSDMTLHGWRQLIEWSLEHASMTPAELKSVRLEWERLWEVFLGNVVELYGNEQRIELPKK